MTKIACKIKDALVDELLVLNNKLNTLSPHPRRYRVMRLSLD